MKLIDIEKLLRWAYCEELIKDKPQRTGPAPVKSAWASVGSFAELLTRVDDNRYGVLPDLDSEGEPHPDAVCVHHAVARLDGRGIVLSRKWNPMPELMKFESYADQALDQARSVLVRTGANGVPVLRQSLSVLVRKVAVLGHAPDGAGECPELKALTGANGAPIGFREVVEHSVGPFGEVREFAYEVDDGWDARRKGLKPGAYFKFQLSPDPIPVLVERGEFALYRMALDELAENLRGKLSEFEPVATRRSWRPWDGGMGADWSGGVFGRILKGVNSAEVT
ncbi:hypothetical protein [Roseibium suaedae]|uniref:Uncharacterized protein n=1 Tax=Roseibium suaedae TaxID=735517 RepID=A0A1M7PM55_9HYPH|nr:hypothetical protein [Roseibium suaedae]SHN18369.1 hypothetical protein SAMN05444272_4508 [Roseibium suaedae]